MNSDGCWGTRIHCGIYRYPPSSIKHDLSQGQKCSRPFDLCLFGLFLKRQENIIWVWASVGFLVSPDFRMAPFEVHQALLTGKLSPSYRQTKSFLQAQSPSYRQIKSFLQAQSPSYRQTKSFLQANQVLLTGKASPSYRHKVLLTGKAPSPFYWHQVLSTGTKSFLQVSPCGDLPYGSNLNQNLISRILLLGIYHGTTHHTGQMVWPTIRVKF